MSEQFRLTNEEIEKFASRKGVKRIAVENFLMSMPYEIGRVNNLRNLEMDGQLYKWNFSTKQAIKAGIVMLYKKFGDIQCYGYRMP